MLDTLLNYITLYPTIPLALAIVILLFYTAHLHHKIHRFTRGQNASSLEDLMRSCVDSVSSIEKRNELISEHALHLEKRLSQTIRNAQTIRYKAFEQNGSNQSFSVALLNEKGNGVVITSLHSHDRISTFAKPIERYGSLYDLTDEEQDVIAQARESHK